MSGTIRDCCIKCTSFDGKCHYAGYCHFCEKWYCCDEWRKVNIIVIDEEKGFRYYCSEKCKQDANK